jgi:hypothetical protein
MGVMLINYLGLSSSYGINMLALHSVRTRRHLQAEEVEAGDTQGTTVLKQRGD